MKTVFSFLTIGIIASVIQLSAQNPVVIKLDSPSFEDVPKDRKPLKGWNDVNAFFGETPPDTQPGSFGVTKPAQNGKTYLGLVDRKSVG